MSDPNAGTVLFPRHVRVSVSPDRSQLAFTFGFENQPPVTMALPTQGAVVLQRNLTQSLVLLGMMQMPGQVVPPAEPAPTDDQP